MIIMDEKHVYFPWKKIPLQLNIMLVIFLDEIPPRSTSVLDNFFVHDDFVP